MLHDTGAPHESVDVHSRDNQGVRTRAGRRCMRLLIREPAQNGCFLWYRYYKDYNLGAA